MDEADSPGEVERESREGPGQSPKTCNLGAWPMGRVDMERLERLSGASSHRAGIFTGIVPLLCSNFGKEGCSVLGRGSRPMLQGTRRDTRGGYEHGI